MNLEKQLKILEEQADLLKNGNKTEQQLSAIYFSLCGSLALGGKATDLTVELYSEAVMKTTQNILEHIVNLKAQRN